MFELPTMNPVKEMERFKKTGEHRFRRIRKDDSLGEEIVFEMGPGRPRDALHPAQQPLPEDSIGST